MYGLLEWERKFRDWKTGFGGRDWKGFAIACYSDTRFRTGGDLQKFSLFSGMF
jgi:hypothetical protein